MKKSFVIEKDKNKSTARSVLPLHSYSFNRDGREQVVRTHTLMFDCNSRDTAVQLSSKKVAFVCRITIHVERQEVKWLLIFSLMDNKIP